MKTSGHTIPVLVVCLALLVVWYVACIPLNAVVAEAKINAAGGGFAATLNESLESHAARYSSAAPNHWRTLDVAVYRCPLET